MTRTADRHHQPVMGWVDDPAVRAQQLTHAVPPGQTVAACGIRTTVRGDPWPDSMEQWHTLSGRCPICAKAVYGLGQ